MVDLLAIAAHPTMWNKPAAARSCVWPKPDIAPELST